jgi:hypothetical protein
VDPRSDKVTKENVKEALRLSKYSLWGMGLTLIGGALNALVRVLNNGMPVESTEYYSSLIKFGRELSQITSSTKLVFLGDVIPVGNLRLSLGDILIYEGLLLMVFNLVWVILRNRRGDNG